MGVLRFQTQLHFKSSFLLAPWEARGDDSSTHMGGWSGILSPDFSPSPGCSEHPRREPAHGRSLLSRPSRLTEVKAQTQLHASSHCLAITKLSPFSITALTSWSALPFPVLGSPPQSWRTTAASCSILRLAKLQKLLGGGWCLHPAPLLPSYSRAPEVGVHSRTPPCPHTPIPFVSLLYQERITAGATGGSGGLTSWLN